LRYLIDSVRLSVHEDVTPRGVNPPLQLFLPLNLTIVVNRRRQVVGQAVDELHSLSLLLFDRVASASAKRRADKLIITLAKLNPGREWLALTRKAWETLPPRPAVSEA
jgi:hypothetical protein